MKRVHLHIGSYKTGTTSIQKTFHTNRNELAQQGFVYPGNTFNHHQFFFVTRSEEKDWPRQFKNFERPVLRSAIDSYFDILEKWLAADFNEQIISTEYLFIDNPHYIKNTVDYLKQFFSDIRIYVFVRNPVQYYRSFQQQKIKACSFITSPDCFYYNFRNVIETWNRFGKVEVIEYKPGRDSSEVFCEKMGLNFGELLTNSAENNSSLSVEQMLLLEKVQRNLYQNKEDRFKKHLEIIQNISPNSATKPKLRDDVKTLVQQNHKDDLEWLKKKYGIDFLNGYSDQTELPGVQKFKEGRAAIKDVYKISDNQLLERYEASVVDLLLKKILQNEQATPDITRSIN